VQELCVVCCLESVGAVEVPLYAALFTKAGYVGERMATRAARLGKVEVVCLCSIKVSRGYLIRPGTGGETPAELPVAEPHRDSIKQVAALQRSCRAEAPAISDNSRRALTHSLVSTYYACCLPGTDH